MVRMSIKHYFIEQYYIIKIEILNFKNIYINNLKNRINKYEH
jgi:hypothetical protein